MLKLVIAGVVELTAKLLSPAAFVTALFCGANVARIDRIMTVHELVTELMEGVRAFLLTIDRATDSQRRDFLFNKKKAPGR